MPRFTNKLGEAHVYALPGHPNSVRVAHDQIVDCAGKIAAETADCYVVEDRDERRSWPKSRWVLVDETPKRAAKEPTEPAEK